MAAPTDDKELLSSGDIYQLQVEGELGEEWSAWFDDLTLAIDKGTTLMTGNIRDQAALHSLLARIRDLGLPLLSVIQLSDKINST